MKTLTIITLLFVTTFASFACGLQPKLAYRTKGLAVTFTNKTVGEYTKVLWNLGDGSTSTESNPQHTYSEAGTYAFSLTVFNAENCSSTFEGKVYVFNAPKNNAITAPTVAAQEENNNTVKTGTVIDNNTTEKANTTTATNTISNLTNYPNPFEVSTTISFDVAQAGIVNVTVYDISGKIVRTLSNSVVESGQQQITFERENLAAGTYLLSVSTSQSTATRLVVVQ